MGSGRRMPNCPDPPMHHSPYLAFIESLKYHTAQLLIYVQSQFCFDSLFHNIVFRAMTMVHRCTSNLMTVLVPRRVEAMHCRYVSQDPWILISSSIIILRTICIGKGV